MLERHVLRFSLITKNAKSQFPRPKIYLPQVRKLTIILTVYENFFESVPLRSAHLDIEWGLIPFPHPPVSDAASAG
jgi:hypothetical protein